MFITLFCTISPNALFKVNELAKYADRQVYLPPNFPPQQSSPKADNHSLCAMRERSEMQHWVILIFPSFLPWSLPYHPPWHDGMASDQVSVKRKFAEGFLENIPFVHKRGGDVSRWHSPLSLFCILSGWGRDVWSCGSHLGTMRKGTKTHREAIVELLSELWNHLTIFYMVNTLLFQSYTTSKQKHVIWLSWGRKDKQVFGPGADHLDSCPWMWSVKSHK